MSLKISLNSLSTSDTVQGADKEITLSESESVKETPIENLSDAPAEPVAEDDSDIDEIGEAISCIEQVLNAADSSSEELAIAEEIKPSASDLRILETSADERLDCKKVRKTSIDIYMQHSKSNNTNITDRCSVPKAGGLNQGNSNYSEPYYSLPRNSLRDINCNEPVFSMKSCANDGYTLLLPDKPLPVADSIYQSTNVPLKSRLKSLAREYEQQDEKRRHAVSPTQPMPPIKPTLSHKRTR